MRTNVNKTIQDLLVANLDCDVFYGIIPTQNSYPVCRWYHLGQLFNRTFNDDHEFYIVGVDIFNTSLDGAQSTLTTLVNDLTEELSGTTIVKNYGNMSMRLDSQSTKGGNVIWTCTTQLEFDFLFTE